MKTNAKKEAGGSKHNVGTEERIVSGIAGSALVCLGLQSRSMRGMLLATVGASALYRAITGQCSIYKALHINTASVKNRAEDIKIEETVSILRPREELFQYWRKVENLPRIMSNVKSVEPKGGGVSHWTVRGPLDKTMSWDAEIINEIDNELIAWRSLPGSSVSNAGSVRFDEGRDGVTHVRVSLAYTPPAGTVGEAFSRFFGEDPKEQVRTDLQLFKNFMEARQDVFAHHTV